MTPDREKLIRDIWERVRGHAMQVFRHNPVYSAILEREPFTWESASIKPAEHVEIERIQFVHELEDLRLARSGHRGWRVVCEGLVIDHGEMRL